MKRLIFICFFGTTYYYEAYEIKNILDDRDKTESDLFLINTGTIDPYVTLWGQKQTSYLKLKLKNPVIKKEDLKEVTTDEEEFRKWDGIDEDWQEFNKKNTEEDSK